MELFFYFFQNLQYLSHLIYNYFCFTIKYETILENKRTQKNKNVFYEHNKTKFQY